MFHQSTYVSLSWCVVSVSKMISSFCSISISHPQKSHQQNCMNEKRNINYYNLPNKIIILPYCNSHISIISWWNIEAPFMFFFIFQSHWCHVFPYFIKYLLRYLDLKFHFFIIEIMSILYGTRILIFHFWKIYVRRDENLNLTLHQQNKSYFRVKTRIWFIKLYIVIDCKKGNDVFTS